MAFKKVKTPPEMFKEMVAQCRKETDDLHKIVAQLVQKQTVPADTTDSMDTTLKISMVVNGLIQDVEMLTTRMHYLERELDYLRASSRKGDLCS